MSAPCLAGVPTARPDALEAWGGPVEGARLSCGLGGACTKRWWSWEVLGGLGLARRLEVPDRARFIPKPQPRSKAASLAGQNGLRQRGLGQTSGSRSPCRALSSSRPRGAHKFLSPAVSVGPLCTQWGFSHQHSRVPGPSPEFGEQHGGVFPLFRVTKETP